jgi:hypothetical protein
VSFPPAKSLISSFMINCNVDGSRTAVRGQQQQQRFCEKKMTLASSMLSAISRNGL